MIKWLASYPKSGNTWLRMFFNAYVSGMPVDINNPYQYIISDVSLPMFQTVCAKPVTQLTHLEQFYYRPAVLLNMLSLHATDELVLKTHHAKAVVDDIHIIPAIFSLPSIYLIRDPRDIAISYARHTNISINESISQLNNPKQAGDHENGLIHLMLTWSQHVESWTVKNNNIPVTVLKYEDLLEDPDTNFKAALKAFNLDFDSKRFKFALEQSSFDNLKNLENQNKFREATHGVFFKHGRSVWKNILTKEQREIIWSNHKEVIEKYYG